MTFSPTNLLKLLSAVLITGASASAQVTWVVDDDGGPGVDFTDIQMAVDAASSGDLIDVRDGDYGGFVVDTPLRIMGSGSGFNRTEISGVVRFESLPANTWSALTDMRMDRMHVDECAGTVLLDDLATRQPSNGLLVTDSADVRARGLSIRSGLYSAGPLATVRDSRLQVADSVFRAPRSREEVDGVTALLGVGASLVHATDCEFMGGRGGDQSSTLFPFPPGDGGPAMVIDAGCQLRLVRSNLLGGEPGLDPMVVGDGYAGDGLVVCGGVHRVFESTVLGGDQGGSGFNGPGDDFNLQCGAIIDFTTVTPSMDLVGVPSAGALVSLDSYSAVSDSLRILFGRFPVRVFVPGVVLPRLVDVGRIGSLGAVPASGVASLGLTIPSWPRGTVVFLQVSKTSGAGVTDFTNSVALIVR